MPEVLSELRYRCNGCGFGYSEPVYCFHCGTLQCPACKRAGCISTIVSPELLVSNNVPLKASELKYKRNKGTGTKSKKKTSKKKRSLAQMSDELGIKLDM
jgi:uncharacterized Zn finger protein (UPF0148 family)